MPVQFYVLQLVSLIQPKMLLRVTICLSVLAMSSGTKIREIQVKTSGDPDSGYYQFNYCHTIVFTRNERKAHH